MTQPHDEQQPTTPQPTQPAYPPPADPFASATVTPPTTPQPAVPLPPTEPEPATTPPATLPIAENPPAPPVSGAPAPVSGTPAYPTPPTAAYPTAPQAGYPVSGQPAYPVSGQPAYPAQPGYPAAGQAAYPTSGQPAYPTSGQPAYPTSGQPAYPVSGQPAYPGMTYPGAPGVPAAPVKKSKAPLIIGIVLGVLLLLCGGGIGAYVLLTRNTEGIGAPTAKEAAQGFLTAVYKKDGDAAAAEKLVCGDARDRKDIDAKIAEIKTQTSQLKGPNFTWETPKISGETATQATAEVTIKLVTSDEKMSEQKLTLTLVKHEGWFVCEVK